MASHTLSRAQGIYYSYIYGVEEVESSLNNGWRLRDHDLAIRYGTGKLWQSGE